MALEVARCVRQNSSMQTFALILDCKQCATITLANLTKKKSIVNLNLLPRPTIMRGSSDFYAKTRITKIWRIVSIKIKTKTNCNHKSFHFVVSSNETWPNILVLY